MKKIFAFIIVAAAVVGGCKPGVPVVKQDSTVTMHYTLTVEGKVVDSSSGKEPLTYKQGSKQIIPGLEEALVGLKAHDKKTVVVAPEKGYGTVNPAALQKVPRKSFKDAKGMKVGDVVSGQAGDRPFQAVIAALDKDMVTLDLNHPLAGKTLNFDIEIVDVRDPV
ncbi:MAG: peptidylprolyl isomerase [Elusimicrobiota bacterium]